MENLTEYFELKVSGKYKAATLKWPIEERTKSGAYILINGDRLWIPWHLLKDNFFRLNSKDHLFLTLNNLTKTDRHARVPVTRNGKGPTDKSAKFKFDVVVRQLSDEYTTITHHKYTRTFAISNLITDGNKLYLPVWVFKEVLKAHERLHIVISPTTQALVAEVKALVDRLEVEDEQARQQHKLQSDAAYTKMRADKEAAQLKKDAEDNLLMSQLKSKVSEELYLAAAAYCKTLSEKEHKRGGVYYFSWPEPPFDLDHLTTLKRMYAVIVLAAKKQKAKPRIPDKVITNARVEWVVYEGPRDNSRRVEYLAEGCIVKYFGKKRIITFSDGGSMDKMESPNLKISEMVDSNLAISES